MVDLNAQYDKISAEVRNEINEVINSAAYINGPAVKDFTRDLGKYLGTEFVLPCANGTDALQIALMALDLPAGFEIIVPTFNYVAAAEMIALTGHKPVFIDAHPDYFNLNIEKLEQALTKNTKAIIAVHLFGQSTDLRELLQFCKLNDLFLIEDNAQSIGGKYVVNGEEISNGLIGDIGTTSFFPSKNLGCFGDGGAVYTKDKRLFDKMKVFANHGQEKKYFYNRIGINSRLDSLQAAVLKVKLRNLDKYISKRREAAHFYDDAFADLEDVQCPAKYKNTEHVYHQYTLKLNGPDRDKLREFLAEQNIPSMIYYPRPLHLNKAYEKFGYSEGDFPIAEDLSRKVISLPMHTELSSEQLNYICENFRKGIQKLRN